MAEAQGVGVLGSKDFDLKSLILINSAGQSIELRSIFVQMFIFQDIYSSVMSGQIVINDGNDLFNNFSLCGNEYLRVVIDKPGLDEPLSKTFRVYKTTDRKPTGDSSQSYMLHFCSEELILSNSMRMSKSYKDALTSTIVADILVNQLFVAPERIAFLQQTQTKYDLIVPNYRPLEAIQWVCSRSWNTKPEYCFFFFENTNGYNFRSLQSLYSQPVTKKIKRDMKNVDPDPALTKDSFDRFNIINDFDMLTSVSNGAYASKLLAVDIFAQTFNEYDYSLAVSQAQKSLLNPHLPLNMTPNKNDEVAYTAFNSYYANYIEIKDTKTEKENSVDKWMMPRMMHMAALNAFKFRASMPGDIMLKAGDIVEFEFMKFKSADESGKELDEFRSGKYLVTAVNHQFVEDTFQTIAEFASDSFASPLPAAIDLRQVAEEKG